MIQSNAKLNALDIVVIEPLVFSTIFDRIKVYGSTLKKDLTENLGFVLDLFGVNFIFYYENGFKITPFNLLQNRVTSIKRNWVFANTTGANQFQAYLLNNMVEELNGKETVATIAKEINNGSLFTTLFYILTADKVEYPPEFVDGKICIKDLLDEELGFFDVQHKGDNDV